MMYVRPITNVKANNSQFNNTLLNVEFINVLNRVLMNLGLGLD